MKLHSIQALRGVAVLLVFLYHVSGVEKAAIIASGGSEAPLVSGLWTNGYAGVDLFFVISGFIIVFVTGEVASGSRTAAAFLFARLVRIYPLWWFFAGALMLYFFVTYGAPLDIVDTASRGQSPTFHLVASLLLLPQYDLPVLPIGWTLIHEVYFYIGFALLLLAPPRFRPALLGVWAALVLLASALGLSQPFAINIVTLIAHPLTLEFLAGAFAGLLVTSGRRWRPGLISALGIAGLVAMLAWRTETDDAMMLWGRVLYFGPPCVLLVYGLASLDVAGRIKLPVALVDLGNWSFSFYLSHIMVIKGVERLFPVTADALEASGVNAPFLTSMLRIGSPGLADNLFFFVASLMLAIIVSWIAYRFIEKPLLRRLGKARSALFASSSEQLRPRPIRAAIW